MTRSSFVAQWRVDAQPCIECGPSQMCIECVAGRYESSQGNRYYVSCPANSDSSAGSALFTCNAGLTGFARGGPRTMCVAGKCKTVPGDATSSFAFQEYFFDVLKVRPPKLGLCSDIRVEAF